ncbi:PQQ-dependent sugar dehydrogenase [Cereibacter johrii]|uniref:PQQ-dependent sugar dehydrogenase n=1 Tax=Cereibacter johrii TaxID=445629 RepID=UPI000DCAF20E|nr:PQQ-dependent sugar dehydrogenase [Cereibacter johrii]RAZ86761.1 PQQ-dependent sugar dehydrogenase [Cereibacter johrii]
MIRRSPLVLLLLPAGALAQPVEQGPAATDFEPAFENQTRAPALEATGATAEPFVEGLEHPWGIAALPDGGWLVTERPGRLRMVSEDGTLSDPIEGLPEVDARKQGGLLDVAVGPTFAEDRMIYWTYAKAVEGGTITAAARGVLSEDGAEVSAVEDIFRQEPPSRAPMHYGSRILFDGEGHAIITTGEHSIEAERERAQDLGTSYGKVIRVALDGGTPEDNPFADGEGLGTVWSYGHRNIQSAAFDAEGQLWIVEHGPKGGDELNLIQPGANYGWPEVSYGVNYDGSPVGTGEPRGEGFTEPTYYWDPVIAPGDMTFYEGTAFEGWQGDLLVGSMKPGGLVRLTLEEGRVAGEERLLGDVGRVRDVEETAEGHLLLLIDAPDGGILRVTPEAG